jgi:hypothetical protein
MSEKKGYIPKDQRKKILFLADDMRVTSGVGTMAREIIEGTAHHFNWVQVGAMQLIMKSGSQTLP